MADPSRAGQADPAAVDSRTSSPVTGKKRAAAAGHWLKKVTLTKPTYCHSCSDFIWGLVGFLCEGKTPTWSNTWAQVISTSGMVVFVTPKVTPKGFRNLETPTPESELKKPSG